MSLLNKLKGLNILRITGGFLKGRQVKFTGISHKTRPTSSLVRQAIFNTLGSKIKDSAFLDLFCGSGIMGLEALSRGAKSTTFVEWDKTLCQNLKVNIDTFKVNHQTCVINRDVLLYLKTLISKFDVIYVDPPYKTRKILEVLNLVLRQNILAQNGLIILEHDNSLDDFEDCINQIIVNNQEYVLHKTKKYGQTYLTYVGRN